MECNECKLDLDLVRETLNPLFLRFEQNEREILLEAYNQDFELIAYRISEDMAFDVQGYFFVQYEAEVQRMCERNCLSFSLNHNTFVTLVPRINAPRLRYYIENDTEVNLGGTIDNGIYVIQTNPISELLLDEQIKEILYSYRSTNVGRYLIIKNSIERLNYE